MGSMPTEELTPLDIPVVDFGAFLHGTQEESEQAAKQLVKSFEAHGFVRLTNHGVAPEFIEEIWKWGRLFFNLPEEEKMKILHLPSGEPQRGWSRKGLEVTSKLRKENRENAPKEAGDLLDEKEHFDCGPPGDAEFPNAFPSETVLPGYQAFMEGYFNLVQAVSMQIMRACEIGFGMPQNSLVSRCTPAASELRLLHYPSVSVERLKSGVVKRAWPHTDFGIITLLFQDGLGGLEVEDRRRPFTFAPIDPGDKYQLVVNTSDTFTRWTNEHVTAGVHQVEAPPAMRGNEEGEIPERYSSVFFVKAHREVSVGPIDHFVSEKNPAKFPEISALQFHREMTNIIY